VRLEASRRRGGEPDFTYDVEAMKLLLEEMCAEAGVEVLLHSRITDVVADGGRIEAAVAESHGGAYAYRAHTFVDATGNGDLGAAAGVGFASGHPKTGRIQPATLFALVSGVPEGYETRGRDEKQAFRKILNSVGVEPSYKSPSMFLLPHPQLWCLMTNHEYDVRCDSATRVTEATLSARRELHDTVVRLRSLPDWADLRVVATADHIGLREGRRLEGRYQVSVDDVRAGRRFEDGICRVSFPVDIHALDPEFPTGTTNEGVSVEPYEIPFRSLVARGYANLGIAGRCVSGDFYAHASYRVTGNAVPMGEAVGIAAAHAAAEGVDLEAVDGAAIRRAMEERGNRLGSLTTQSATRDSN
jgi:hypothetical protein